MGIYDRDYYSQPRGFEGGFGAPRSAAQLSITVRLILLNAAIYIVGLFFENKQLPTLWFGVTSNTLTSPLHWYQFLTYGFIHSPESGTHLLFNMLGLWFLGRPVEDRLGRREFLTLYLFMIVAGGVFLSVRTYFQGVPVRVIGASGAISGIILLFVFYYPRLQVLFMFFLPMPAWILGVFLVAYNLIGAASGIGHTAFDGHLTGMAVAALYYYRHWNLSRTFSNWIPSRLGNPLRRRPKLRVLRPDKDEKLAQEADRILEKLHREGIDSLTPKERRILNKYSRKVRGS